MNREALSQIIDGIANGDSNLFESSVKQVTLSKLKERLGYETLTEVGDVKITNNDVFVSGKKVGTVNIDNDDTVVEFTDNEGEAHQFEDTESLYRYLNGINESEDNRQQRLRSAVKNLPDGRGDRVTKAANRIVVKSNAGDGEEGDYTKKDTRGSEHKDSRMDKPKKHDHGHDDKSGIDYEKKSGKGEGSLPEDKKHSLKGSHHKDSIKDNPKSHDHGHDDSSGVIPQGKKSGGKSNPPDKGHELKGSHHKDGRMENPKKHDHGHDDPSATGNGKNK